MTSQQKMMKVTRQFNLIFFFFFIKSKIIKLRTNKNRTIAENKQKKNSFQRCHGCMYMSVQNKTAC